jgi:hypothetical protein
MTTGREDIERVSWLQHILDVRDAVSQRERQLLYGRGAASRMWYALC